MINVGHDKNESGTYKVWYDFYFPRDRLSFANKEEALDFALKFHAKKQTELKSYNFTPRDVFIHCPENEIAELKAAVEKCLTPKLEV